MGDVEREVCVIGLWHLGCVYAACLAKLGYRVVGTDEKREVVDTISAGRLPIFEPGLEDLVRETVASGKLRFEPTLESAASDTDYVIIAYDTPVDSEDRADPSVVLRTVRRLKSAGWRGTLIVSSQVPVGTCQQILNTLSGTDSSPDLAYVPENLRLGQAIERFMTPDMIVIGANNPSASMQVRTLFAPIKTKILEMDLNSAEMTKHALNAFLATSISFANEMGNICDFVGADGLKIAQALRADSRIGPKALLKPGLGFSGGTLSRDLRILQKTAQEHGYEAILVDIVLRVNERQNASVVERLNRLMDGLEDKVVGVLGLTYKAGTNTLRRSVALQIVSSLVSEGAHVKAYDSHVSEEDLASAEFALCHDVYEACKEADALLILNDWPGFMNLDFQRIRDVMRTPLILDTQNLADPDILRQQGFKYVGIGRGMAFT